MTAPREVTYTDELLADRTVHRRYSDGREEWRTRLPSGGVTWRDNHGRSGTDEPLAERLVKRTLADGSVLYGRDVGYGRTLWRDGVLTVNRSSIGGRVGLILAGVAGGALLGSLVWPPDELSFAEEEALRQQLQTQQTNSTDSGGGGGGDGGYSDWDDSDNDGDADGDFG